MAWDDLHDSNNPEPPRNPRGTPPGGGGGSGGGGGGGPQFEIPQFKIPKLKGSSVTFAIIILLALFVLPSVAYFVDQGEEGVVVQFGKYVRTTEAGPHLKLPSPIEHVYTPNVDKVRVTEIGFRQTRSGQKKDFPQESLMLTGDQNIVDIDLVVQWKIYDSKSFLFNVDEPIQAVHNAAETTLRGIIGQHEIDEVLTTGRAAIQIQLEEQMQLLLDSYGAGIQITTIQLKDVDPPAQVIAAFNDVTSAKEDKERMIHEAEGYRNAIIPEARGKAAQVVRKAEAYNSEVTKKAEGDASRFMQQYQEYKKAPKITRKRIYLETMEEVYPQINKFIVPEKGGGVLPILPLNSSFENALSGNKGKK